MGDADDSKIVKLDYEIHKCTSFSGNYKPDNITINRPTDQLSRWFTDSNTPPQYIILKLKEMSILETIMFGKYIKAHVSDLKKFEVYGGTDDQNMSLLLSAGLKNDSSPETFQLRNKTKDGLYLPVKYIKIVPLQSWGPAYIYTIWYVELYGRSEESLVRSAMETIELKKEEEAVRLVLKHLRRHHYKEAFEALSRESGVTLEGPIQGRLWTALVENGDYDAVERIMEEALEEGEFDWYVSWQPYQPQWRLLSPCSALVEGSLSCPTSPQTHSPTATQESQVTNGGGACSASVKFELPEDVPTKPGPRGGHQLVVDSITGTLYLFGGWNGTSDLDDLWLYDTSKEQWQLVCEHSGAVGGPSPRSCHKMLYDPHSNSLYTLGRYLDLAQRHPANMKSDMHAFNLTTMEWSLLSADTSEDGGPRLVFDHQMCIDIASRIIYVFGGRVLPHDSEGVASPEYSGLFAYHIDEATWQEIRADSLKPRVGHSMLFHPEQRRLYVFAGQRNKEHLVELVTWDVGETQDGDRAEAKNTNESQENLTQTKETDTETKTENVIKDVLNQNGNGHQYLGVTRELSEVTRELSGVTREPSGVTRELSGVSRELSGFTRELSGIGRGRDGFGRGRDGFARDRGGVARDRVVNGGRGVTPPAKCPPPTAGFTQRATLDPNSHEMFVFSGMSKEKDKRVHNTLWVVSLKTNSCSLVYRTGVNPSGNEPRPRYAHQLVYDHVRKIHYLFGGNPGIQNCPRLRLDDLWSLRVSRGSGLDIVARCRRRSREARFRELAGQDCGEALEYLRTRLSEAVDHSDAKQVAEFQKLATVLFSLGWTERWTSCVRLDASWTRRLAGRCARAERTQPSVRLAPVLGITDAVPEPIQPVEIIAESAPDTWDVGEVPDDVEFPSEWNLRHHRIRLYNYLTQYFRPSTVPPKADVSDLVQL